ncbi:MAG: chloride channel protein [Deferribacteres bacterium]|nr:chloride channel protein [Deferribacteres bacterium]
MREQLSRLLHALRLEESGRWVIYGLIIGVISGLGAAVFFYILEHGKHFAMCKLAGFEPPAPYGERLFENVDCGSFNRLIFFFLPAVGGLISGLLVYTFAPEAEGHGTDAMIEAFHTKKGKIRGRVPIIKTIATVAVLSTGGSAGREGPTIQIGAGFGSFFAEKLRLTSRERRIMLIAGAGGGLGAIFRAPLGGALTAMEVLYKEDLETEALIPTVISSITAYIIFTLIFGHDRIFYLPNYFFHNIKEVPFYIILGFLCVPLGAFYVKFFYWVRDRLFKPMPVPRHIKPAIGGLLVGMLGLFYPQVYGDGWGWIQQAILGDIRLDILYVLIVLKIMATSFTIASGGSGGVFGPTLFIGGMIGGVVGYTAHHFFPHIVTTPGAYVVVGMSAFFAGVANAPIGSLLMCSEMTGGYGLITPLLLVSIIALIFTRRWSIYEKQVWNKFHSPAHAGDVTVNILEEIKVKVAYKPVKVKPVFKNEKFKRIKYILANQGIDCIPVEDENGNIIGMISYDRIKPAFLEHEFEDLLIAEDIMVKPVIVTESHSLYEALIRMLNGNSRFALVVDENDPRRVLGILRFRDIMEAYNREIAKVKGERD